MCGLLSVWRGHDVVYLTPHDDNWFEISDEHEFGEISKHGFGQNWKPRSPTPPPASFLLAHTCF